MSRNGKAFTILLAEDDEDDRMLAKEALDEAMLANDIRFVEDGEELMDYLHHRGKYADQVGLPRPGLILLDLNMPKKDGREVLEEIKSDTELHRIPVVVLTTSNAQEDISFSYEMGVNSYITKPVAFDELVDIMKTLGKYWFGIVSLPVEN